MSGSLSVVAVSAPLNVITDLEALTLTEPCAAVPTSLVERIVSYSDKGTVIARLTYDCRCVDIFIWTFVRHVDFLAAGVSGQS